MYKDSRFKQRKMDRTTESCQEDPSLGHGKGS